MAFKGKAPGSGAGDISKRTEALRPALALTPKQVAEARTLRRAGATPAEIADRLATPVEEVERALLQMRMPRPETTRGTLNVTLAAHRVVLAERRGDEPLWQTFDRLVDELLSLRRANAPAPAEKPRSRRGPGGPTLPGL